MSFPKWSSALDLCREDIARLLRAEAVRVHKEQISIHATIQPSASAALRRGRMVRPLGEFSIALVDFFPVCKVDALLVAHHRVTSGTADAVEFQWLHQTLDKFRLGAIGRLAFGNGGRGETRTTIQPLPLFLSPLVNGFDLAFLRTHARSTPGPRLTAPRLVKLRIATGLMMRLDAIDDVMTSNAD